MPQTKSYFCIRLPHDWYLFGLDNGLTADIDPAQTCYFAAIAKKLPATARVIVVTHDPNWIMDVYDDTVTGSNLSYLMRTCLRDKVALRLAGDVHNYSRHEAVPGSTSAAWQHALVANQWREQLQRDWETSAETMAEPSKKGLAVGQRVGGVGGGGGRKSLRTHIPFTPASTRCTSASAPVGEQERARPPTLIVSGGGGAFLHPTHVPALGADDIEEVAGTGHRYTRKVAYPPPAVSRSYSKKNLVQFRQRNFQFDLVGGVIYLLLIIPIFPLCGLRSQFFPEQDGAWGGAWGGSGGGGGGGGGESATGLLHFLSGPLIQVFLRTPLVVVTVMFESIAVSNVAAILSFAMVAGCIVGTDSRLGSGARLLFGASHGVAHLLAASLSIVILESCLDVALELDLLGQGGVHSAWDRLHSEVPHATEVIEAFDLCTLGLASAFLRASMMLLDAPSTLALLRNQTCIATVAASPIPVSGTPMGGSIFTGNTFLEMTIGFGRHIETHNASIAFITMNGISPGLTLTKALMNGPLTATYVFLQILWYWAIACPLVAFILGL